MNRNNNSVSIKLRSLTVDDYSKVLNWSKDDSFCSVNGWEKNRSPKELYKWWLSCVNNAAEDFIRLGIEFNEELIGYADLACIKANSAELGIAIGESRLWGEGHRIFISYIYDRLRVKQFRNYRL